MIRTIKGICMLCYLSLCLPIHSFAQPVVKAANADVITYRTDNGYSGRFTKAGGNAWTEHTAGGVSPSFVQNNIDEWSIYLGDASRNITIQLDLFQKKIYIDQPGLGRGEMANITGAWTNPSSLVKADNLSMLAYSSMNGAPGGNFIKNTNNTWTENAGNSVLTFSQVNQDEWSVYLKDPSRNMEVQLDLFQKRIYVEPYSSGKRAIGIIENAWAAEPKVIKAVNLWKAMYQSTTGGSGYFQKAANGQWTENAGGVIHNFVQYNQDEWSVYLKDNSRSIDIQIDLFQKKIYVEPYGNGRREIATVTQVM